MNSYYEAIEDSDEEMIVEFTGPRSGRFLPLWHHVHEKSYHRKKELSDMLVREGQMLEYEKELKQEIKDLEARIARLTPGVGLHTERVSDLINPERTRSWLD